MTPELIAGGGGTTRSVQADGVTLSGAALRSLRGPTITSGGGSTSSSGGGGGSGGGSSPGIVDRRSLRGPDITSGDGSSVERQVRDVDMVSLSGASGGATIRDRRSNSDGSEQPTSRDDEGSSSVSDRLLSAVSASTPDEPVESVKEGAASVRGQFQAGGVTTSGLSGGGDDDTASSSPKEVFAKAEGDTGGGNLFNKLSAAGAQSGVPGLQGASRAGRANVYEYTRRERAEGSDEEVTPGGSIADEAAGVGRAADYAFDNPAVNVQRGSRRTYNVATGQSGERGFTEDMTSTFEWATAPFKRGEERLRSEEKEDLRYFSNTPAEFTVSDAETKVTNVLHPGAAGDPTGATQKQEEQLARAGELGRKWVIEEPWQGTSKTLFGVDPRSGERNVDPSAEDVFEASFSALGPVAGAPGVATGGVAAGYKGLGRLAGRAGSSEATEEVTEQVTKAGSRVSRGAPDDGGIKQSMVNPLRAVRVGARATADRLPSRFTSRLPTRGGSSTADDFSRQVGGGSVQTDFLNTRGTGPVEVESTVSTADEFTRQSTSVTDDVDLVRADGDASDPTGLPVVRDEVTSSGDPLVRGGDVAGERGAQITDDLTSTPDNLPVPASRFGEDAAGGVRGGTRRAGSSSDEFAGSTDEDVAQALDDLGTGRGGTRAGAGAAAGGGGGRAGGGIFDSVTRGLDDIRSRFLRNEPPGTARAGSEPSGRPRGEEPSGRPRVEEPTGRPRGEEPGRPRGEGPGRGEEPGRPDGPGRPPRDDDGGGGGLPGPTSLWAALGLGAAAVGGYTYNELTHPQQAEGGDWIATKQKTYRNQRGEPVADLYHVKDKSGQPLGYTVVLGMLEDGTVIYISGIQNPVDQVSAVTTKEVQKARRRAAEQRAAASGGR